MWEHYNWVVKVVLSAAIENIVRRALNADNPHGRLATMYRSCV